MNRVRSVIGSLCPGYVVPQTRRVSGVDSIATEMISESSYVVFVRSIHSWDSILTIDNMSSIHAVYIFD